MRDLRCLNEKYRNVVGVDNALIRPTVLFAGSCEKSVSGRSKPASKGRVWFRFLAELAQQGYDANTVWCRYGPLADNLAYGLVKGEPTGPGQRGQWCC